VVGEWWGWGAHACVARSENEAKKKTNAHLAANVHRVAVVVAAMTIFRWWLRHRGMRLTWGFFFFLWRMSRRICTPDFWRGMGRSAPKQEKKK